MGDPKIGRTLLTPDGIQERIGEMAARITEDYRGKELVLVGILKGAFIFLADLSREIGVPVEFDFMALSSYGSSTKTSGVVRIIKDLDMDIADRDVLLVEDIIDTGLTLKYLKDNLWARGPASLEICALLNKRAANKVQLPVRYEGFSIEDEFVVGYGLDYAQQFRNLPYIAVLER